MITATLLHFPSIFIYLLLNKIKYLQDDYTDALNKLVVTVTKAYKINPSVKFEVFIHKVDGLNEDNKMETQRDIHQRANDDLSDSGKAKTFFFP